MMTCLKYLLPISCVLLLGVSLWQVLIGPLVVARPLTEWLPGLTVVNGLMSGACVLFVLWVAFKLITTPSKIPVGAVSTPWGPAVPPGPLGPRPSNPPAVAPSGQILRN